jgi:hypothetical protein
MFQFPGFALNPYSIQGLIPSSDPPSCNTTAEIALAMPSQDKGSKGGFPIRRFLDQSSFAAPQDLSQRTTSFIASQRQGIHQMLLRHLITLMINVRPAKSRPSIIKERPVFGFASKDIFLLAKHIRHPRLRAGAGSQGLGDPAGRICRLFTISNIRAHPPRRRGEFL